MGGWRRDTTGASTLGPRTGPATMTTANPIQELLEAQGFLVLDGGLATALEAEGFDLDDELWSARLLIEAPLAIRAVHTAFLEAGADCIATSSYQASYPGFRRRGLAVAEASALLELSVAIAVEARDAFWAEARGVSGRWRPLVAASVGPYGAFLADGSEYRGDYGLDARDLRAFHEDRWRLLAASDADLLACETIPSRLEASVLADLLAETANRSAWISFSCRDEARLSDGSPIEEVARDLEGTPGLAALGVNCTAPELIAPLLERLGEATSLPVLAYPNLGEAWDPARNRWRGRSAPVDWETAACEWRRLGARGVGGCCRVGPSEIARVRARLEKEGRSA